MEKQIIFYTIPLEELKMVIKECLKSELTNFNLPKLPDEELMTSTETAQFLRVSKVTLHQWKKAGLINFKRIGTRVRFLKSDVLEALKSRRKYGRET